MKDDNEAQLYKVMNFRGRKKISGPKPMKLNKKR
jgi:hypothetical protein